MCIKLLNEEMKKNCFKLLNSEQSMLICFFYLFVQLLFCQNSYINYNNIKY